MESKAVFKGVTNNELRKRILSAILETRGMIPSFKTFHQNMLYLGITAYVVKTYIVDRLGKESIYKALSRIWHRNRPTASWVEHKENTFRRAPGPPRLTLDYQTLVVSALRLFACISGTMPRSEPGEPRIHTTIDRSYQVSFLRKAQRLGFNTPKVEQKLATMNDAAPIDQDDLDSDQIPDLEAALLKRRCGRPFARSYTTIKNRLFLPQLCAEPEPSTYPTTLFIQNDFIRSCHGWTLSAPNPRESWRQIIHQVLGDGAH